MAEVKRRQAATIERPQVYGTGQPASKCMSTKEKQEAVKLPVGPQPKIKSEY